MCRNRKPVWAERSDQGSPGGEQAGWEGSQGDSWDDEDLLSLVWVMLTQICEIIKAHQTAGSVDFTLCQLCLNLKK